DRPIELCIAPAPIDQPSCRRGRTNRTISGPAFSRSGETTVRFAVAGGEPVSRTVVVETAADARSQPGPYRILAAAATYRGRAAEAQQIVPRRFLRHGARFIAAIRRDHRIVTTAGVVLRRGGDAFDRAPLRRTGCSASMAR